MFLVFSIFELPSDCRNKLLFFAGILAVKIYFSVMLRLFLYVVFGVSTNIDLDIMSSIKLS